jgi:hypothetical protein
MELSMELCNVVTSIKKRIIKLGFSILLKIKHEKHDSNKEIGDEEEFKIAVSHLIKYFYFNIDKNKKKFQNSNMNYVESVKSSFL